MTRVARLPILPTPEFAAAPSRDELLGHLRVAHGIDPGTLGIDDLLTLHDNDHNRRGDRAGHGHKKAAKGQSKGYAKF